MSDPDLSDLRLGDVRVFLHVARLRSVNAGARALGVSPSHVSKAVARLERHLGLKLVGRSARGVVLTDDGQRLQPRFVDLLGRVRALSQPGERPELVVVAPAFLSPVLLPAFASKLPNLRIHNLERAPGAQQPICDVALVGDDEKWPESWTRSRVGQVRRGLFAAAEVARALGPRPSVSRIAAERFVGPLYADRGQLVAGDDRCPLAAGERRFGHRTQTVQLALALAEVSGQLVFAPVIAARPFVTRGSLVEIPVDGWHVRDAIFLTCHEERVEPAVRRALAQAARDQLRRLG